jgi:hypothetical protein
MQALREENSVSSSIGVLLFAISGFILSAWATYAIWEILKAPIIIELLAVTSGAVGALTFALIAIGIRLVVR